MKGCIEIRKDSINSMVYLRLSNVNLENSFVYYCPKTLVEESREAFLKFHRKFIHLDQKVAAEHTKSDVSVTVHVVFHFLFLSHDHHLNNP